MFPAAVRERLGSRKIQTALVALVVVVAALVTSVALSRPGGVHISSRFVTGTPEAGVKVELDTSLYLPDTTPAPAVLLSQGFGGSKSSLATMAKTFAQRGFVALTYSARGFGDSGGLIHFASPDYEVHDGSLLIDYLAKLKSVKKVAGKAQIATAGASYGGGLSLLIAAADSRVRAISADITWNNLSHALFPNFGASGPGVFKKLWAGQLFGNAFSSVDLLSVASGGKLPTAQPGSVACGRFAADVCAAYQASAAAGSPNAAMTQLMSQASPANVLDKIRVPTQLTQGEQDSLFPLSEADANARGIAAHRTPVCVVWRPGGHDAGSLGEAAATSDAIGWFEQVFTGNVAQRQPFQFAEQAGVISAETGNVSQQTLRASGYPGIAGTPRRTDTVSLAGSAQRIASPAGGAPAVLTSIPGLGGVSGNLDRLLAGLPSAPGQTAVFSTSALKKAMRVAGQSTVRITVTTKSTTDAVLFAGLRDVDADGAPTLPAQLVSPIKLTGMAPGVPRTVTVRLPSFVRNVLTGHRLALSVSASDFSFDGPADARQYKIALPGGRTAVTVPTTSGASVGGGHPFGWLIVGGALMLLVAGSVGFVILRRRRILKPRPDLAEVPVAVEGLVKEYAGGYRAVDDVSFEVRRGQVVGLLGPNGAGKTTVLRVLVGLITPTKGNVYVFGQPVVPGAPVLARLGAFIEGPGFLPHLSGRENLRLFWAATGRDFAHAEFDTSLDIAGLGGSIDRRVRSYSQGMRQRLGIAQAMLGLPEVLVLDEPTNGLDPPQIAEMREVLQDYARTGRTVVVSSHLLAEVEQTCTDVVVMHRGKVVAAGSVAEIAGAGGQQLAVDDPVEAARILTAAGVGSVMVPARRALEDVFLGLIGDDE